MPISLKVQGVPEAVAALNKVGAALSMERIQDCLIVGAQMVRDRAKQYVRTGPGQGGKHLRDMVFASKGKVKDPKNPSVIVGVNRKRAPAAGLVEFGHGGPHPAPPHPYLRSAMDASKKDIPRVVQDMMRRTLESFGIDTGRT